MEGQTPQPIGEGTQDCKAAGGFDDGGADFAFNGFGNDIDNIGF